MWLFIQILFVILMILGIAVLAKHAYYQFGKPKWPLSKFKTTLLIIVVVSILIIIIVAANSSPSGIRRGGIDWGD